MQANAELRYSWKDAAPTCAHAYLMPTVSKILQGLKLPADQRRLFDLGCGNGSTAARLSADGWKVTGIDSSEEGISRALAAYPGLDLHRGSAYDDLPAQYGRFQVCLSLEVAEHVYDPRDYAKKIFGLCLPGATAILSTPYHGYLKNLAISLMGGWDAHFTALWDGGHIKFWSVKTLGRLLEEAGFETPDFHRVGRVPALAKSMIAVARRPA